MTRAFTDYETAQLELIALRQLLLHDHIRFTRYFFKLRETIKFQVNWHHAYIGDELEDIILGKTDNLLINVAPGSSKTELAVINFMARGLALNPRARFLHLSYSDDLTVLNSSKVRDIVVSEEYQALWPRKVCVNTNAKKRWNVEDRGKQAGGVYATAIGGQVTGFRGGHMADGFQGGIVVDDPLKPEDAFSKAKRGAANRKLLSTVKSRKACPQTPTITIMQRLAADDAAGYILDGNVPGRWKHIVIPALIDDAYVATLPRKYQDLIEAERRAATVRNPRDAKGRYSYWPAKEPLEELLQLEKGGKDRGGNAISSFVFHSQYQQQPKPLGGQLIQGVWFRRYAVCPKLVYRIITADTAQKTAERNDYSVLEHWGLTVEGQAILLDVLRGKWTAPDLRQRARDFWVKCEALNADHTKGRLREMHVEDKASGTGLVQELAHPTPEDLKRGVKRLPVKPIERNKDKLTEWMDATPHMEIGSVAILDDGHQPWITDFIDECEGVTAEMTHTNDDQVDALCDAVDLLVANKNSLSSWQKLANTL